MKNKIIAYLKGPRLYAEGMTLYDRFGDNLRLKATFRRQGETELTRTTLMEELRKLAGLSEQQFHTLPRMAAASEAPAPGEESHRPSAEEHIPATEERAAEAEGKNTPATESLQERVSFRNRYPFLREPDCPDVLKVLTADMFAAYDRYREAHEALAALPDDAALQQAEKLAAEAVENYLHDRSIMDELTHYRDHRTLLAKHPKVAAAVEADSLAGKTDLEVEKVRKNAASNASKWKKKLMECTPGTDDHTRCAGNFRRWELLKMEAEKVLDDRKKNG